MRNEGLFSVTELIIQRIPGVKIFPMNILRIFFFNHKHCFVFGVFSMSHLSLIQTAISIKHIKKSSIAQAVFNHSISLNSQFFMCNAWATIIVSFLKIYFLYTYTLLISWMTSFNDSFSMEIFYSKRIQLKNVLIYHVYNLYVTIATDRVMDRWAVLYCCFQLFLSIFIMNSVYFHFILKDVGGKIQDQGLIYLVSQRNRIALQSPYLCGVFAILFLFP